jgi:MFS transporter, DHA2 family, methylenomycin A resistance protein
MKIGFVSMPLAGHLNPMTAPAVKPEVERRQRRTLFAVCFGFFLVLLDTTALNIATPVLGHEFGNRISDLQWVVNS